MCYLLIPQLPISSRFSNINKQLSTKPLHFGSVNHPTCHTEYNNRYTNGDKLNQKTFGKLSLLSSRSFQHLKQEYSNN